MTYLSDTTKFREGVPAITPRIPAGWMLRTSIFDYPAAISPEGVEWIIAIDGVLYEAKAGLNAQRRLTGKSQSVEAPFGDELVEDRLQQGRQS
jgi:hypothetical protein